MIDALIQITPDGAYYEGVIPFTPFQTPNDARIAQQGLFDPLMAMNQSEEIRTGDFSGLEAYDFQNPYVFMSRNVVTVSTMLPEYGVYGDTQQNVLDNIAHTGHIIQK